MAPLAPPVPTPMRSMDQSQGMNINKTHASNVIINIDLCIIMQILYRSTTQHFDR